MCNNELSDNEGNPMTDLTINLSSHIMHIHAGITFHYPVTLIFNLLISESMHSEIPPYSIGVPRLVFVGQIVFVSECRYTLRQTCKVIDVAHDHPITHASATTSLDNNQSKKLIKQRMFL